METSVGQLHVEAEDARHSFRVSCESNMDSAKSYGLRVKRAGILGGRIEEIGAYGYKNVFFT